MVSIKDEYLSLNQHKEWVKIKKRLKTITCNDSKERRMENEIFRKRQVENLSVYRFLNYKITLYKPLVYIYPKIPDNTFVRLIFYYLLENGKYLILKEKEYLSLRQVFYDFNLNHPIYKNGVYISKYERISLSDQKRIFRFNFTNKALFYIYILTNFVGTIYFANPTKLKLVEKMCKAAKIVEYELYDNYIEIFITKLKHLYDIKNEEIFYTNGNFVIKIGKYIMFI